MIDKKPLIKQSEVCFLSFYRIFCIIMLLFVNAKLKREYHNPGILFCIILFARRIQAEKLSGG